MDKQTRIRSRTQLISFLEKEKIQVGQGQVRKILEYMHHGNPTYITHEGKLVSDTHRDNNHIILDA